MQRVAVIVGSCQPMRGAEDAPPTLPPSDRAAIGLAVQRFGSPIDAYCLRDDAEAWRYALAAGAATARRVHEVAGIDFDLALVGSAGAEPWGDLLPALLAEHKQCAMVFEVLDVTSGPDGLTVTRDLGRGNREVLVISPPAVLAISEHAVQLLYVSHYRRQTVCASLPRPSPEPRSGSLSPVSPQWEPARPRVKTGDLAAKTTGPASGRLQALMGLDTDAPKEAQRAPVIMADAVTCARHLLRFLRHHGMLTPSVPPHGVPERPEPQTEGHAPASPTGVHEALQPEDEPAPPLSSEKPTRGPRVVGQTGSRRGRGPRPVE